MIDQGKDTKETPFISEGRVAFDKFFAYLEEETRERHAWLTQKPELLEMTVAEFVEKNPEELMELVSEDSDEVGVEAVYRLRLLAMFTAFKETQGGDSARLQATQEKLDAVTLEWLDHNLNQIEEAKEIAEDVKGAKESREVGYTDIQVLRGSKCNVACQFCFTQRLEGESQEASKKRLKDYQEIGYSDEHLFLAMLHARMAYGLNEILFSSYGDPLAKANKPEFLPKEIAMAKAVGFPQITVLTNGVGLTEENIDAMVASGLTNLTVSLHTPNPTYHQEIIKPPGREGAAHAQITKMVQYAASKYPDLIVRINVGYFKGVEGAERLIEWARDELGAKQITLVEPILANEWTRENFRELPERIEGYQESGGFQWGLRILKPESEKDPTVALCSIGDKDPTFATQGKNVMLLLSGAKLKVGGLWTKDEKEFIKTHYLGHR